MSILHMNFRSRCLNGNTDITLILPDVYRADPDWFPKNRSFRVLYLLHGSFGDHSDWTRFTNVERYACEHDLVVVMPSALNTNYVNWGNFGLGHNVFSFFFEELMPMVENWFPVSRKKEDTFIAGLSMGGRGACLLGFARPEKFGGIFSMSAAPNDLKQFDPSSRFYPRIKNLIELYQGKEGYLSSPLDLLKTMKEKKEELPPLYFYCGKEDPLAYKDFLALQKYTEELGLSVFYREEEGYGHEWAFWDLCIRDVIVKIADEKRTS